MAKAPPRPDSVPPEAVWDVDEWLACARDDDNLFQGPYRNWFPDGRLKYEGQVKDSKQQGEHRSYHPDGSLFRVTTWREGTVLDDQYSRCAGPSPQPLPDDFPESPQVWTVKYCSDDGKVDRCIRYFDRAGAEVDRFGEPAPARPAALPPDARWRSRFSVDDDEAPAEASQLGAWSGKLRWESAEGAPAPHGWVEGASLREGALRLGTWRWWSPEGSLLREEVHDQQGQLVSAREWDRSGRELTAETMDTARAALAAELDRGYEVFLGKPLSEFDPRASYALFFCIESSEDAPGAVGLEAWDELSWDDLLAPTAAQRARDGDRPSPELGWERLRMDRGRSLFFVREKRLRKDSGSKANVALPGAALAAEAQAAGLTPADLLGDLVYVRAQTDGTLRDAMAAATWTMSAPLGLVGREEDDDDEAEEAWASKLDRAVKDERVRGHLKQLCVTGNSARASGGFFLGDDLEAGQWDWVMTALPGTVLAAWQFGEGYASAAVVQLR